MKKHTTLKAGGAAELGPWAGVRNCTIRTSRSTHPDDCRIGDIDRGEARPVGKLSDKSNQTIGWIYEWSSGELSILWLQGCNGTFCIEWLPGHLLSDTFESQGEELISSLLHSLARGRHSP